MTVLASGSGGNSILVESERTHVLVDAGLNARDLSRRLDRTVTGTRLDDVQAVLVTHEHNDHASGVAALASAGLAVYATAGTARAGKLSGGGVHTIAADQTFTVGALRVTPFAVPHDAAEPVCFHIADAQGSVAILTDVGHPTPEVAERCAASDVLFLEANYDPDMLRAGSYPPGLKRRIGGSMGHLSNDQAAELLRLMRKPRAQALVLGHLSQLNNRPRLARSVIERTLAALGVRPRLLVAVQERPLQPIACEAGLVRLLPAQDDRQLCIAFPD